MLPRHFRVGGLGSTSAVVPALAAAAPFIVPRSAEFAEFPRLAECASIPRRAMATAFRFSLRVFYTL